MKFRIFKHASSTRRSIDMYDILYRKRSNHAMLYSQDSQLKSLLHLLFFLLLVTGAYFFTYLLANSDATRAANQTLPILLIFLLLWTGLQTIRENPLMIWSPIFWFLVASALYFGFGPLIYHYGDGEGILLCDQFYFVDEMSLLRTNMLNSIGILLVIIGFLIGSHLIKSKSFGSEHLSRPKDLKSIACWFLSVGLVIKYLFYMPFIFGMTNVILPHSIGQLQGLVSLAIIPLMILAKEGATKWRVLLCFVIVTELLFSMLEFSKMSVIITLLMVTLGYFIDDQRWKVLVIGFLCLFLTYIAITPFIPFGREEVKSISDSGYQAGLKERYAALRVYIEKEVSNTDRNIAGTQAWWARLNYATAQTFALDQYDQGRPGKSFSSIMYTPIPRFLWPDKPSLTDIGLTFNYMVNLYYGSSAAPGFFAEAYWNGGALMVIIVCLYVGILFAAFTKYSVQKLFRRELIFLPVVFLGMKMGFRPDGWFVGEYVGITMIAIFTHYLLSVFGKKVVGLGTIGQA